MPMPEPTPRPAIASSPISVLLFAHAFDTETNEAIQAWRHYLGRLQRSHEIFLIQETRSEVSPSSAESPMPVRTFNYDRTTGFRDAVNQAIRSAQHPLLAFCTADK